MLILILQRRQHGTAVSAAEREASVLQLHGFNSRSGQLIHCIQRLFRADKTKELPDQISIKATTPLIDHASQCRYKEKNVILSFFFSLNIIIISGRYNQYIQHYYIYIATFVLTCLDYLSSLELVQFSSSSFMLYLREFQHWFGTMHVAQREHLSKIFSNSEAFASV